MTTAAAPVQPKQLTMHEMHIRMAQESLNAFLQDVPKVITRLIAEYYVETKRLNLTLVSTGAQPHMGGGNEGFYKFLYAGGLNVYAYYQSVRSSRIPQPYSADLIVRDVRNNKDYKLHLPGSEPIPTPDAMCILGAFYVEAQRDKIVISNRKNDPKFGARFYRLREHSIDGLSDGHLVTTLTPQGTNRLIVTTSDGAIRMFTPQTKQWAPVLRIYDAPVHYCATTTNGFVTVSSRSIESFDKPERSISGSFGAAAYNKTAHRLYVSTSVTHNAATFACVNEYDAATLDRTKPIAIMQQTPELPWQASAVGVTDDYCVSIFSAGKTQVLMVNDRVTGFGVYSGPLSAPNVVDISRPLHVTRLVCLGDTIHFLSPSSSTCPYYRIVDESAPKKDDAKAGEVEVVTTATTSTATFDPAATNDADD